VHRAEEPAPAAPRSEAAPAKAARSDAVIEPRAAIPSAHLNSAIRLLEEPAQPQAGNVSGHIGGTGG